VKEKSGNRPASIQFGDKPDQNRTTRFAFACSINHGLSGDYLIDREWIWRSMKKNSNLRLQRSWWIYIFLTRWFFTARNRLTLRKKWRWLWQKLIKPAIQKTLGISLSVRKWCLQIEIKDFNPIYKCPLPHQYGCRFFELAMDFCSEEGKIQTVKQIFMIMMAKTYLPQVGIEILYKCLWIDSKILAETLSLLRNAANWRFSYPHCMIASDHHFWRNLWKKFTKSQ